MPSSTMSRTSSPQRCSIVTCLRLGILLVLQIAVNTGRHGAVEGFLQQHHPSFRRYRTRKDDPAFISRASEPRDATQSPVDDPTVVVDHKTTVLTNDQINELNELVERRSKARWDGEYEVADQLRHQIEVYEIDEYEVVLEDVPRKQGGGSKWSVIPKLADPQIVLMDGPTVLQLAHAALGLAVESSTQKSLLWAQRVVGVDNNGSDDHDHNRDNDDDDDDIQNHIENDHHQSAIFEARLQDIVEQTKRRFTQQPRQAILYELGGRKAADAAFWFALAGCTDVELFDLLLQTTSAELQRFGQRSSCRPKDIYQILERLSAAGITTTHCGRQAQEVLEIAQQSLATKHDASGKPKQGGSRDDTDACLELHSTRSLLLIWKFSTKQKKQRAFLQSAVKHWEQRQGTMIPDAPSLTQSAASTGIGATQPTMTNSSTDWFRKFQDPARPLVVDIGCGMGVSPLGLASLAGCDDLLPTELTQTSGTIDDNTSSRHNNNDSGITRWSQHNFCGIDLGGLGIGYAQGMAQRRDMHQRLQFLVDSAENFCDHSAAMYPGPIPLCMIQFPTPYRLATDSNGNSQLPRSAVDGFMVTQELLSSVYSMLAPSNGRLLLQSNCEDVAVFMRQLACEVGFEVVTTSTSTTTTTTTTMTQDGDEHQTNHETKSDNQRVTQRTADWIAMGGERAVGDGWFARPVLPSRGATETEVACHLNGTPVHRCVLTTTMRRQLQ